MHTMAITATRTCKGLTHDRLKRAKIALGTDLKQQAKKQHKHHRQVAGKQQTDHNERKQFEHPLDGILACTPYLVSHKVTTDDVYLTKPPETKLIANKFTKHRK